MPLVDLGDIQAEPGSRDWSAAVRVTLHGAMNSHDSDAQLFAIWVHSLREAEGYRQLCDGDGVCFETWGAFCEAPLPHGLDLKPDLVRFVEANARDGNVVDLTKQFDASKGNGERGKAKSSSNRKAFGGTTQEYIVARLKRDADPETTKLSFLEATQCQGLLDRIASGDLSPRAAGIEAGFVADEFSCPKDPTKAAQRLRRHFTGDRLTQLREVLNTA